MTSSDWQPIATAPAKRDVLVGWFGHVQWSGMAVAWKKANGRWHSIPDQAGPLKVVPTHWMPLPGGP